MSDDERRAGELAADGDRLIDWLGCEASAQRETTRDRSLLIVLLACGFAALVVAVGRGQAAAPALALAALFLALFAASFRQRAEEGARAVIDSLRERPDEVRRIAHVAYGRGLFERDAVVIESDRDGYLFVKTGRWNVVLNGLAARCRNARVELCARRPRR